MNQTQDILFGETQVLVYDVMEGRPSAVSMEVRENSDGDDDTAEANVLGSPAIETNPNTTFASASGVGQTNPRILNLTSGTGVAVNRTYLATDASGRTEWVEIVGIDSNTAYARHPLRLTYAAADTFVSTRVTSQFQAAWLADEDNLSYWLNPNPRWRVRVESTISGVHYVGYKYFDVVRWNSQCNVTAIDVDHAFPGFIDSLPVWYRDNPEALMREALRQVKMDLYGQELADQQCRNAEVLEDLVLHKTLVLAEMSKQVQGNGNEAAVASAQLLYQERFNSLIRAKVVPAFGASSGGAAQQIQPIRITRR